jgi:hypothetical protein
VGGKESIQERLTPQERAFVDAFVQCGENASQAAEIAGFAYPWDVSGVRVLGREKVQKAIAKKRQELRASNATADFVLSKLVEIASSTATDAYDEDERGELRLKRLKDIKIPVQKVSVRRNRTGEQEVSVQTPSQVQALEMLGRHLALFTDNVVTEVRLTDADREQKRARLEFLRERIESGKPADDAGSEE